MNVNPLIMQLKDVTGFPVVPDLYAGKEKKWITFTYEDERTNLYSDDGEEYIEVTMQINLFTPVEYNYFDAKHEIKKKLLELGFQIESIQSWISSAETSTSKVRQTSFTCNYTNIDN